MLDCEARELRRRVARLKRDRPGFRFSAALRAEISAWAAEQRERGTWWCDLSRAIGVPAGTLKRWAAPHAPAATAMLPVEVIDAPPMVSVSALFDGVAGAMIDGHGDLGVRAIDTMVDG